MNEPVIDQSIVNGCRGEGGVGVRGLFGIVSRDIILHLFVIQQREYEFNKNKIQIVNAFACLFIDQLHIQTVADPGLCEMYKTQAPQVHHVVICF